MKLILEARKSSEKKKSGEKKNRKKKQAEKANSPLNQKARVKRIQGFEHQWIGGPKEIKSRPKWLNQASLTMCLWHAGPSEKLETEWLKS